VSQGVSLLEAFERQVNWCRQPAPFTAKVLARSQRWLAQDAAAHAAFDAVASDPLAAAVALRWAGALHHLALRGLPPWAALWAPSAVSAEVPDAILDEAIRLAWSEHRAHCQAALALPPQTNEVQRSAVLLPGLLHVAARTALPLQLLEIGASAGLNLWCDHFGYDFGSWTWGDRRSALQLRCEWRGRVPDEAGAALQVKRRAGCDAHPIDLSAPDEGLRLASFIWPDQAQRLTRLQAARDIVVACMAQASVTVQAMPAALFVRQQLPTLPVGQATVLMHSVVWQYIAAAEQAAITAEVQAAGSRASASSPLAWLRFEPPATDRQIELRCRLWQGSPQDGQDRLLARSHPHGAYVEWLG
jgi:hypothetical protein